jgi:hypothetical protein
VAFTDDFTGTDGTNLNSRSGWTLIDGVATSAQINASNELKCSADQSSFKCTDQGSANHYTQAIWRATSTSAASFVVIRLTNASNFIGIRNNSNTWQLYKRVAGTFTLLGSYASTPSGSNVIYIEGNSNSITVKVDGTTRIGPITETFNNTVTVQGLVPRSFALNPWIDDFDAGALSSGLTINATQAIADASGYTANIDRQLAISATTATATASGYTANVDLQTNVTATQAIASAIGYDATISTGLNISATQAVATASGYDANIDRQLNISATQATASALGYTANISIGVSGLKYWNGSAWATKTLKEWDGAAWQIKTLKRWNGSAWI